MLHIYIYPYIYTHTHTHTYTHIHIHIYIPHNTVSPCYATIFVFESNIATRDVMSLYLTTIH